MYHCTLQQLGKGKTRSCDNDLVHETDEIELTITNHSNKEKYFCNPNEDSSTPVKR